MGSRGGGGGGGGLGKKQRVGDFFEGVLIIQCTLW